MPGVRCSFWELGAVVRHERQRHDAGKVRGPLGQRKFRVPAFLTSRDSGLPQPEDPAALLADAEAAVRGRGWIEQDGQLSDQAYEIVSALVHGESCGFLQIGDPGADEVRVMVASHNSLAFRVILEREDVLIDEVTPDAAWRSLASCLPEVEAAEGRAVSVPSQVLGEASAEAEQHRGEQDQWLAYELRRRDVPTADAEAVGAFNRMADRTTMQIAVAVREKDGTMHIGPHAINMHHAPSGRVAMYPQLPSGATTTIGPADAELVAATTRQYLDALRQQLADAREQQLSERGRGWR